MLSEHQRNVAKVICHDAKRPPRHVAFINICIVEVIQMATSRSFPQLILSLSLCRRSVQAVFKKCELRTRERETDRQTAFDQRLIGLHVPSIRYTGCT